jgi:pimeloyl-ACP methyl ester carboxylesterase
MRQLARTLSARGWHVLRFDYYGTGDSAGDFAEANREQWLADVDTAVEELKDIGQLSRVALVGMRVGGALAAQVAERRRDVDRIVLWDPVMDGKSYLLEVGAPSTASSQGPDVLGVVLAPEARRDMEAIRLDQIGPGLPKTLVLDTTQSPKTYDALVTHLRVQGVDCSVEHVPDVQAWREEWGWGGVGMPVTAINAIAAWMA